MSAIRNIEVIEFSMESIPRTLRDH